MLIISEIAFRTVYSQITKYSNMKHVYQTLIIAEIIPSQIGAIQVQFFSR